MLCKMLVRITKPLVNECALETASEFVAWNPSFREFLLKDAGEEHYKLLNFLAKQVAQTKQACIVSDIGTLYGCSALAFAFAHPSVQVTTYDINNVIPNAPNSKTIANVTNITRKFMSGQIDIANIAKSDIVLLDIDPHEGVEEKKIVDKLKEIGFKGLLVVDDINLNDKMKAFWESIALPKYDVTKVGHWTGTGIVVYDESTIDVVVPN